MPLDPILTPDPPLSDGVVMLRAWTLDDAEVRNAAVQDPEIPRYLGIPENQTLEGTQAYLTSLRGEFEAGMSATLAVVDVWSGEIHGSISVTRSADDPAVAEIGYWVAAPARGRGVATRAVELVVPWAFSTLDIARLEITAHHTNGPSRRVAEKAGFRLEGELRAYREHQGERVDLLIFSRLPTD